MVVCPDHDRKSLDEYSSITRRTFSKMGSMELSAGLNSNVVINCGSTRYVHISSGRDSTNSDSFPKNLPFSSTDFS